MHRETNHVMSSENSGHWHKCFFVHVRKRCFLSWCSYSGGYLMSSQRKEIQTWVSPPPPVLSLSHAALHKFQIEPYLLRYITRTNVSPVHPRSPQPPRGAESVERIMSYPRSGPLEGCPHGIIPYLCLNEIRCYYPFQLHGSKVVTSFPPRFLPKSRGEIWVELLLTISVTMWVG